MNGTLLSTNAYTFHSKTSCLCNFRQAISIVNCRDISETYCMRSLHGLKTIKNAKCGILLAVKKTVSLMCSVLTFDGIDLMFYVSSIDIWVMIIANGRAPAVDSGLPPETNNGCACACLVVRYLAHMRAHSDHSASPCVCTNDLTYFSQDNATIVLIFVGDSVNLVNINACFFINFISQPVISGFTSAAAVTIASSQLKALFGLKLKTQGTLDTWIKVATNITSLRWQDLTLGISGIIFLNVMQSLPNKSLPCKLEGSKNEGVSKKILFYTSLGRNALLVIVSSIIAYCLDGENQPFTLTGHVEAGIPPAAIPAFSITRGNGTLYFMDIMADVGIGVVMIPFVSMLYIVAIASAFSKGQTVDASQEILALGITNVVGAFFGSMPVTAAMSRTAVNAASGVRTQMGRLVTGAMVLLALMFLTPYFRYIPKACLGAIIMCAVVKTIDYEIVLKLWGSKKQELLTLVITFIACLFLGLDIGIIIGIAANLGILLFSVATPSTRHATITSTMSMDEYVVVTVKHGLQYPGTAHVRTTISKAGLRDARGILPVVVDCSNIHTLDYTAAKGFQSLAKEFSKRGQILVLVSLSRYIINSVGDLLDDVNLCQHEDGLKDILCGNYKSLSASKTVTSEHITSDKEEPLLAPVVQQENV
ncbi:unnamed protein product, partial [Meganyctiphanes norvegica]